jgi:hypothetical protein
MVHSEPSALGSLGPDSLNAAENSHLPGNVCIAAPDSGSASSPLPTWVGEYRLRQHCQRNGNREIVRDVLSKRTCTRQKKCIPGRREVVQHWYGPYLLTSSSPEPEETAAPYFTRGGSWTTRRRSSRRLGLEERRVVNFYGLGPSNEEGATKIWLKIVFPKKVGQSSRTKRRKRENYIACLVAWPNS